MDLREGSTLSNRGPSLKPPVTPGPGQEAPEQGLVKVIDNLKNAIVEIIKGTEWAEDSKEAAKGLIDVVESSLDIPNTTSNSPQDIQDLVEQYAQVLEDVHARLKDASAKKGIKSWTIYQTIRSMASKRSSRCMLLFQTCQHDLSEAAHRLRERMDSGQNNRDFGPPPEAQIQETTSSTQHVSSSLDTAQSNPDRHAIALPSAIPARNPLSPGSEGEESCGSIQGGALNIARKTFKAVEIASGSIPVAGSYIATVAKVGLAFVEMIQTMNNNDNLAQDLGTQTARLSKLLVNLTGQPRGDHGELIADHITDLQKEIQDTHNKMKRWNRLGYFDRAFNSHEHAELLKAYQGTVQTALEELQLLISLDTRDMIIELKNAEAQREKRQMLDRLGDGKYGAQGNAIEDVVCFPGTRVEILKRIDNWIRDSSASDRVLWIRGMAGRGKSTIASTVVHGWKSRASCAIFHFRRGQNAVNTRFVCTLARQLGSSLVPEVKNAILETVRENQDIANERLEEQFNTLFAGPLSRLNGQSHPILIVIDALDECDNTKDAIHFVHLLDRHSTLFPPTVKFLLTCRPEAALIRTLEPKAWHAEDLDTVPDLYDDLERFAREAFNQIRDSHPTVPEDWPTHKDILHLVEMSQGLFQWARTAITYIGDGSPVNRLRVLLKRPSTWSGLDDLYHQILSKAFDKVRLDPSRLDVLCRVLGTLIVAPYPISLDIIASLYSKHEIFEGTSHEYIIQFLQDDILADLNSLLFIPTSPAEPMHLMHTSIRDLLSSKNRCEQRPYYINVIRHHQQLASMCFEVMLGDLKENVFNLSDISKGSRESWDVMERDPAKALIYCCLSWPIHLTEGIEWQDIGTNNSAIKVIADFELFSTEKLMFWLEVISMVGATKEAIGMAKRTHDWLLQRSCNTALDSLTVLWEDVQRFIAAFREAISFGPLHVYISSLPHCPVETEIWKLYGKFSKIRTLRGLKSATWPANLWSRCTAETVVGVAFAPDGKTVVSASDEGSILFWDTETGTEVDELFADHDGYVTSICLSRGGGMLAYGSEDNTIRLLDLQNAKVRRTFNGHSGGVSSVCFSPDGRIMASGSDDSTIRLWCPQAVGEPLRGHSDSVHSICFAPDGKLLASGSHDQSVRLWDPQTGAAIGEPLVGHIGCVKVVCFSPDGRILASGSTDMTIRLWDLQKGEVVGKLPVKGRECVNSICFSPDGKILACASDDRAIQLWDPQTQAEVGEPLTGHGDSINSVCFSPDGEVLASGSVDCTIRLWNPRTGARGPVTDHTDSIRVICSSPDGQILTSGLDDHTIRLWDPHTGFTVGEPLTGHSTMADVTSLRSSLDSKVLASGSNDGTIHLWNLQTRTAIGKPLTGHSHSVHSVAFSPDGKILASGSLDQTIRLWDTRTQTAIGEPLTGHTGSVEFVCFSPDGKVLASGSADETIRLWDPHTAAKVGEPLTGHTDFVGFLCFSPDNQVLASGSDDGQIRLWDPRTGTVVGELFTNEEIGISSMRFLSDGLLLKAQYRDGSSVTWDTITHQSCGAESLTALRIANPSYQSHWVTLFSSPFFWLSPQYWGDANRVITLLGDRSNILVVLNDGTLSIFDISQALELVK